MNEAKINRAQTHETSYLLLPVHRKGGDSVNDAFPLSKLPPPTTVDVWLIELDRPLNSGANLDNILSLEERNRAARFAFERDALRFRLCRATLRLGLGWYLQRSPRDIALATGAWGKPILADGSELRFNISHSEGLGLIAFTTLGEIGIDIESLDRAVGPVDIASTYFAKGETAMIAAGVTPQDQSNIFLRLWTRKEAVLKAAGYGIARGLDMVDVSQLPAGGLSLSGNQRTNRGTGWLVKDLESIKGFVGAVAAPPGDWSVQQWQIRYEDVLDRVVKRFPGAI
jgi:4'-phosphopantetheinyl transferase